MIQMSNKKLLTMSNTLLTQVTTAISKRRSNNNEYWLDNAELWASNPEFTKPKYIGKKSDVYKLLSSASTLTAACKYKYLMTIVSGWAAPMTPTEAKVTPAESHQNRVRTYIFSLITDGRVVVHTTLALMPPQTTTDILKLNNASCGQLGDALLILAQFSQITKQYEQENK